MTQMEFQAVSPVDIRSTIASSAVAQLDPSTPGGAAVKSWSECGYSTDSTCLANALAAGMAKSKNRTVREAAQTSLQMGGMAATACTTSGVFAAFAPLCGAAGAIVGALAGVLTARAGIRHEAGLALREAWWGANVSLLRSIQAIKNAYGYAGDGSLLTDDEAVCLLVDAMKALGSKLSDRIWGPYPPSSQCGVPGRICSDAIGILQSAQGNRPLPVELTESPYSVMEKWWMLKGDGDYGNCINRSDIKNNSAWQDKVSTRRERASRMILLSDEIMVSAEIVIATMINLKDQRSRDLASAYYSSSQYQADIDLAASAGRASAASYAASMRAQAYYSSDQYQRDLELAASAGRAVQSEYGAFMRASGDGLRRYCGMSHEESGSLLAQGSEVFLPILQECEMARLLDLGYHPDDAMAAISSGVEAVDAAVQRGELFRKATIGLLVLGVGVGGYYAYRRYA